MNNYCYLIIITYISILHKYREQVNELHGTKVLQLKSLFLDYRIIYVKINLGLLI